MSTTLAEQADAYAADTAAPGSAADLAIRRAYMTGALAALTIKGRTREQLLAECLAFGRAIGTPAERATTTTTTTTTAKETA